MLSCIHAVVRFFGQIYFARPSPPTYFNELLEKNQGKHLIVDVTLVFSRPI